MNDLEICKRIAEIEGEVYVGGSDNVYVKCQPSLVGNVQYNPLTDDALCFQLMIKYRVYCEPFMLNENWSCRASSFGNIPGKGYVKLDSLNRAICLAIIEAHKEQ